MKRIGIGVVAMIVATMMAQAEEPADAFDKLPNIHFAYYDVTGTTVAEIKRSIAEVGPRDQNDLGKATARTEWYVAYHWVDGPDGKCSPALTTASFEAFVILPRLATPVGPELTTKWKVFLSKLRHHEANHSRYAYDHMPDLMAAVRAAPSCEATLGALAPVVAALRKHDTDYDAATDHGRTEGVVFE